MVQCNWMQLPHDMYVHVLTAHILWLTILYVRRACAIKLTQHLFVCAHRPLPQNNRIGWTMCLLLWLKTEHEFVAIVACSACSDDAQGYRVNRCGDDDVPMSLFNNIYIPLVTLPNVHINRWYCNWRSNLWNTPHVPIRWYYCKLHLIANAKFFVFLFSISNDWVSAEKHPDILSLLMNDKFIVKLFMIVIIRNILFHFGGKPRMFSMNKKLISTKSLQTLQHWKAANSNGTIPQTEIDFIFQFV